METFVRIIVIIIIIIIIVVVVVVVVVVVFVVVEVRKRLFEKGKCFPFQMYPDLDRLNFKHTTLVIAMNIFTLMQKCRPHQE